MIRHPSENYLKYLITLPDPQLQDNARINIMISLLGVPAGKGRLPPLAPQ